MRYLLALLILTSCTVGVLPTPEPTITLPPTATPWLTNTPSATPSATATLTAVNITPSPEASPTLEVWIRCVPDSYAYLDEYALLYKDEELTEINLTDDGLLPEVWRNQPVLLYWRGQRQNVWWVRTATNIVMEGYLDSSKLPVDCR